MATSQVRLPQAHRVSARRPPLHRASVVTVLLLFVLAISGVMFAHTRGSPAAAVLIGADGLLIILYAIARLMVKSRRNSR
jgi:hypothetical protein